MADRQLFDTTAPITGGRYAAPLNISRAQLPSGPQASQFANPTPTARMGRGGLEVQSGGDALRTARSMGMKTAPVAMSMAGLRKAHAAGLLGSGPNVQNMSRRAEVRQMGTSHNVSVRIDLTDMAKLAKGFIGTSVYIREGHGIISKSINDGMRRMHTITKRKLQKWTGIKQQADIGRGFRTTWSTAATMTSTFHIADRHRRITTENFDAKWERRNPGGTHKAWNRPQLAKGTFMIRGGGRSGKIRGDILFKRIGAARFPIAPVWGPNMAREFNRHRDELQREFNTVVAARVSSTAVRLMQQAIAKAGG